ncbi:MAG: ATP-binding protein [Candidatus Limnocylindrales bacterium]
MLEYQRRVVDDELDELLPDVAAISIEGARAVGKTRTGLERAATVYRLDDPGTRATIEAGPDLVVAGPRPVLIDEWQLGPDLWDLVRRAVDTDRTGGQFILTGSAMPKRRPTHSGAGRIVSIRMRPMTLSERGLAAPSVSLGRIIRGETPAIGGDTDVALEQYAHEILASGFPGLRGRSDRAIRSELDGYIARVVEHDFEDLGGERVRNDAALRRWLRAYASAVSSTASYEKIRDAATAGNDEKPSRPTAQRYLDVLERLWLIEPIPAWIPERNLMSRLAQAPKHQVVDPALVARLRGATMDTLLRGVGTGPLDTSNTTLFGALFESQIAADVRVYAQGAEARVGHFRSRNGDREIDLIVERADGRVVAIEVKLARVVRDEHVKHLLWLRDRLGRDLLDAILISTGPFAYRRRDGIAVVPAALLGA